MPSAFRIRRAVAGDAAAVTDVLLSAGLAAWSEWLGEERIRATNAGPTHPANLVAEDDDGVFAFIAWDTTTGEVTRLYTHPRGWRRDAAAILLAKGCEALRLGGHTEAWLHTEQRNTGPDVSMRARAGPRKERRVCASGTAQRSLSRVS